jgi:asparagine synthase (glutamine-hydrolysing)
MCGIAGIINKIDTISEELMNLIQESIAHRGPDSQSRYVENHVGLIHNRLAILDLSVNGNQPMLDKSGNYVLVFNGEIYNHLEIRKDLLSKGYTFRGFSDTETLLYGYIEYGKEILNKLNGIFAFCIYDKQNQKLFLARDQMGVKPLYYYLKDDVFLFGSELKSIVCFEKVDKEIDNRALMNYITFLWSPGEMTPFKHINKLLPGHYLTVNTSTLKSEIKQFYDIPFNGNRMEVKNEQALTFLTEQKLFDAVERQMMSDVPVGFFVSGGIDSTLIAAITQQIFPSQKINAFTIDSGENAMKKEGFSDDLFYAKLISKKLDFKLNIIEAKLDILTDFDKMIWHLDEPQADVAPLNVYHIAKGARENGIKVLLGGAGGDDLFSGYRRHQVLNLEKWINLIPNSLVNLFKIYADNIETHRPLNRRLKKLSADIDKTPLDRMSGYFSWLPQQTVKNLFSNDSLAQISEYNPLENLSDLIKNIPNEKSLLNQMLYLEMKSFLVDHNMNYNDKMSMAVGVESRVPFLDMDLVNFSTQIPTEYKMHGTTTKYILKKVAEKYLPKELIYRPKAGFAGPVRQWITQDMNELIAERLSETKIKERGIFNPKEVTKLIKDNKQGKIDASFTIWSLLAIESWMTQFKDGKKIV